MGVHTLKTGSTWQYCTMLFCTIKWCGGQGRTQSLPWSLELPAPVGLLFQPICFCLLTDPSQASLSLVLLYSLMLSIWTCERTALWSPRRPALLGWREGIVFEYCKWIGIESSDYRMVKNSHFGKKYILKNCSGIKEMRFCTTSIGH